MGSFSKYNNTYFTIGRKIIEAANRSGSISEKELIEIIEKNSSIEDRYDFLNAIIGKSDENNKFHGVRILESVGLKTYRPIVGSLPLVLSKEEQTSLKDALSSDIASAFVSSEILTKFETAFKTSKISETLGKIVAAIKSNKCIVFDNTTADGKCYFNQHLKPHKIEYSISSGEYFISGYCRESDRLIKCNLERITIHNIEDIGDIDTKLALEQKRCNQAIRLSIINQKNAIDRAFNMFSQYEKDGFYEKKEDRYILDIHYYEFEERVLLDKILSLGESAIILSPNDMKRKIIERISCQIQKLT